MDDQTKHHRACLACLGGSLSVSYGLGIFSRFIAIRQQATETSSVVRLTFRRMIRCAKAGSQQTTSDRHKLGGDPVGLTLSRFRSALRCFAPSARGGRARPHIRIRTPPLFESLLELAPSSSLAQTSGLACGR